MERFSEAYGLTDGTLKKRANGPAQLFISCLVWTIEWCSIVQTQPGKLQFPKEVNS